MSTNTYPVFFASAYLADSNSGIWTMPASAASTTILQELTLKLTNVTAATRVCTVYAFSSGTANLNNAVISNHSVPPYDYILIPIPRISGSSAVIQGFCDVANAVTAQAIGGKLHVP